MKNRGRSFFSIMSRLMWISSEIVSDHKATAWITQRLSPCSQGVYLWHLQFQCNLPLEPFITVVIENPDRNHAYSYSWRWRCSKETLIVPTFLWSKDFTDLMGPWSCLFVLIRSSHQLTYSIPMGRIEYLDIIMHIGSLESPNVSTIFWRELAE